MSTFEFIDGEKITILGGSLSCLAVSINLDSTFLNAFCQEGILLSAFSSLAILFFKLSICPPNSQLSIRTSFFFNNSSTMLLVFGDT